MKQKQQIECELHCKSTACLQKDVECKDLKQRDKSLGTLLELEQENEPENISDKSS